MSRRRGVSRGDEFVCTNPSAKAPSTMIAKYRTPSSRNVPLREIFNGVICHRDLQNAIQLAAHGGLEATREDRAEFVVGMVMRRENRARLKLEPHRVRPRFP